MTDRRDRIISVSGEDIRRRYKLDDMASKKELEGLFGKGDIVGVENGGTGKSALAAGSFLIGSGTAAVGEMTAAQAKTALGIADYVTEEGSNTNGRYVKWNSGRLEMWGCVSATAVFSAAGNVYYHSVGTITFPFASVSVPYVFASVDMPALASASINTRTKTSFSAIIMTGNSGTSSQYSYRYDYYAIGTWK